MFKKISIVFFSVILFLMNISPSFASVASPSVASPSDAFPMEEYFETDLFDTIFQPRFSSADIKNTVDYANTYVAIVYYDMSNVVHSKVFSVNSSGQFSLQRPSDFASFISLQFVIESASLPPSGKYNLDFSANWNVGGHAVHSVSLNSRKNFNNANTIVSDAALSFVDTAGDFYSQTSVDLNSGLFNLYFNVTFVDNVFFFPNSGLVKFEFTRLASSASVDEGTAGADMSDPTQDTAQNTEDIANNTAQIVEGQDNIMDTIREQVQYITLQLEAFWNQLAGQFTNLFDKMNDQLSQLLNGIEDQTTEVTGAIDDVEAEINQSTTEINQNIDQSTNQITNGYDNSSLNNSANEYHQADQELENAQNAAWDQGAGRIEDFDFGEFDFSPGVMAALSYCGNWLQNVFVGISFFNLPITIGLTIVFALMIIGYYRYH